MGGGSGRGGLSSNSKCGRCCGAFCRRVRTDLLLVLIVIGVVIGFVIGALVNGPVNKIEDLEDKRTILILIGFPGELFMNMLKMLILPLIVASLICALAALDAKATGRVGRRALVYYLFTTILAVILGIVLVVSIRPGSSTSDKVNKDVKPYRTLDAFLDLVRSCFPSNIVAATFRQYKTKYTTSDDKITYFNKTVNETTGNFTLVPQVKPGSKTVPDGLAVDPKGSINVLGLVVFSIVFGIVLGRTGERGMPLKAFFESLNEVVMKMVALVMWVSPIGICSLIAAKVAGMDDVIKSLNMLGMYMLTVISGLLIHALVILPLLYLIAVRKNPLRFYVGLRDAMITAFGTSSSSATLPTTMRCLEVYNKVDARISRFVLPLGATVNMDGTALYEAVAAVFIAQANGITLNIAQLITTCLTATAASIGAAGIPQAGLVTMVLVLQAVNLPTNDIGLILAVDWFLDRIRTTVNIIGDSFGAGIVEHLSRDDLLTMDYTAREDTVPMDPIERYTPKADGLNDARSSEASLRATNF
ncbi:excitatory amino acid transporter 1-like [Montipora capricornis]|uniref:excitatory amino acid transporter 1-like n=1 Tax=Montipora capricornis TaxID=246305 RepID=UPI0035F19FAF